MERVGSIRGRGGLRVVADDGPVQPVTGEQVMREGARVLADYFTRQLPRIPAGDPLYAVIEADASRLLGLAGT